MADEVIPKQRDVASAQSGPSSPPSTQPECHPRSPATKVFVTCVDYSPDQVQVRELAGDVHEFLSHTRPPWTVVRWINIDGVTDPKTICALAEKYALHPLAIEDVTQTPQRPKVEDYPAAEDHHARLFVIVNTLRLLVDDRLCTEQVSMFLGRNTLLTFKETRMDVWGPIRQRIQTPGSRLRTNDVSFLLYSLLDATVDQFFPILEFYSDRLEELEDRVVTSPSGDLIHQIHGVRRELLLLRRTAWPMREVINALQRERHVCLSDTTRTYLRDVYDHTVQIIELVESYREFAGGLAETYLSSMSQRLNEVMKVLTIMGTIFMPLSFLAGVYGMNMPIPENRHAWMYPLFWVICGSTVAGMVVWFKRRGWL